MIRWCLRSKKKCEFFIYFIFYTLYLCVLAVFSKGHRATDIRLSSDSHLSLRQQQHIPGHIAWGRHCCLLNIWLLLNGPWDVPWAKFLSIRIQFNISISMYVFVWEGCWFWVLNGKRMQVLRGMPLSTCRTNESLQRRTTNNWHNPSL